MSDEFTASDPAANRSGGNVEMLRDLKDREELNFISPPAANTCRVRNGVLVGRGAISRVHVHLPSRGQAGDEFIERLAGNEPPAADLDRLELPGRDQLVGAGTAD